MMYNDLQPYWELLPCFMSTSLTSSTPEDNARMLWARPWTMAEEVGAAEMVTVSERMMGRPDHVFSGLSSGQILGQYNELPYDTVITSVMETDSMRQVALRKLQEAISIMPIRDSSDLLVALSRAPELVRTESDPMRYLRCENYNPWAAASSLAGYWRLRRELFGDKSFLPLSLSGESALDPESISFIKVGSNRILPKDSTGRTVMVTDTSRRLHHSPLTRLKGSFFFLTVLSENPISQTDGFLYIITDAGSPKMDQVNSAQWRMVAHFPIRTPLICFCYCVPRSRQLFYTVVINTYIRLGFQKFFLNNKVVQHVTDSKDEMVQRLELMGLRRECIPMYLGGTFSTEDLTRWFLRRASDNQACHHEMTYQPSPQEVQSLLYENCIELLPLAMNEILTRRKAAYLRALEHAPELVQKESNIYDLLSAEDYHIPNTCQKMVDYWELRSQLFGSRALLVMNQTGEGALERSDWAVLRSGFAMVLPNDGNDRSVVAMDPSLLDGYAVDRPSVYRCIFYILSVAAENPTASTNGIVLLYNASNTSRSGINFDKLRAILLALPIQVAAVHVSGIYGNESDWVDELNFGWKPKIHDIASKTMLASALQPYGLSPSRVPVSCGGTWQMSNFAQWQELRIRSEWDLPIRSALGGGYPGLQPRIRCSASSESERNRRMEVVFARRRRDQTRLKTGLFQEEVLRLQEQKGLLVREQQRLEDLVRMAGALVSELLRDPEHRR